MRPARRRVTTNACGINATGQIVGSLLDATGSHGFLLAAGSFTTIDVPGAAAGTTNAYGINAAGQIVGGFADANGVVHGFVASPRAGVGGDRADTSASPRKHWVSERKDRWVTERAQLATDGRTRAEVTGATVSRR